MKFKKAHIITIFSDSFRTFLGAYLVLVILETTKSGFVSFFLDPNILLLIVLVSGTVSLSMNSNPQKTRSLLGLRGWHRFFALMKGRWGKDSKWQFLFKEIRAQKLIDNNLHYFHTDLHLHLRELEKKQLTQSNLSFLLKEISFRRIVDKDWYYFSKEIKVSNRLRLSKKEFLYILTTSILGAYLIYYKTTQLGDLSIILATLGFLIIFPVSYLIITDKT